jgi:hypothetical protein
MVRRLLLGIDPGKVNVGLVLSYYDERVMKILEVKRVSYMSDTKFVNLIRSFVLPYMSNMNSNNIISFEGLHIIIERQSFGRAIFGNMRYLQGYMTALGAIVKMVNPPSKGQSIELYKDRKEFSISLCWERLISKDYIIVKNRKVLLDSINLDERKHDITDSFNITYDYIYKNWLK